MGGYKRGRRERVGGTKGEGLAPPLLSFLFGTWRQETLGFLAPGAWRIAGERGRRERERLGRKSFIFLGLIEPIQCMYI